MDCLVQWGRVKYTKNPAKIDKSAWAVLSGWFVLIISKPCRFICVRLVRCLSDISAMSILLSYKEASNSFLRWIKPFEIQIRLRREFNVKLFIAIFYIYIIYEVCEDLGNEDLLWIYNRFKFVEKFSKWYFVIISWVGETIGKVTISWICIRKFMRWRVFIIQWLKWCPGLLVELDGWNGWEL